MAEPRPLEGRGALVTGAAGGIGAAIARKLAAEGAQVMLTGVEPADQVEPLRAEIARASGARAEYVRADLRSLKETEQLAKRAADRLGPVAILVNNAVVRHFAPIESFPAAQWEAALAVNVSAAFHLTRLTLPAMRKRGYGRIFNITSVYGSRATAGRVDYITSKAAIEGLTRAIAMENADGAVTCHALCPGAVLTPSLEARIRQLADREGLDWEAAVARWLEGKQLNGRFIEPASIADVLYMLCGPVGRDMNGALVPIEGGWLARA